MLDDEYFRMFSAENSFWWYVALREFLGHELKLLSVGRDREVILDAGCGTGANLKLVNNRGLAVGLDISRVALQLAKSRGLSNLVRGSVQSLPFANSSCDVLLSIDVLYHSWIEDDVAVLREYKRVLRPGGQLLIHVAAHEWLRGAHDKVVMTRHRYTRPELIEKLKDVGFVVERATYRNTLLLPLILLRRLVSRLLHESTSDLQDTPAWLNACLTKVLRIENALLTRVALPVGSSVFVRARRDE